MLSLDHFVRTYDQPGPPTWCAELIERFEQLQRFQQANGAGIRPGLEQSAWTELDIGRIADADFRAKINQFIVESFIQYNKDLGLSMPISPPRQHAELIVKRYRAGTDESFQLHFDALGEVSNRYLVFLWYLNDVDEGGATEFPDLRLAIAPKAGRLLVFPPYWMFQHRGTPPISGDKYILSTYLVY